MGSIDLLAAQAVRARRLRLARISAASKLAGVITGPVDLSKTYTNSFMTTANKDLGSQG